MSQASNFRKAAALMLAACFVCSGCGGSSLELTSVSGKVTFDGVPVEEGLITFTPASGTSSGAAAADIKGGEYNIPASQGPMVGKHSVSITAKRKTGAQVPAAMPAPAGTMIDVTEEYIPYKYNFESELTAELVSGENTKNFDLVGE